jgi:homoserine kinase
MTALVVVPASSANLGPGFDALGMALGLHLLAGTEAWAEAPEPVGAGHPALVAFRRLGGEGPLFVRSPIPMGRGLGFSGAARVAGLVAACHQRGGYHPVTDGSEVLAVASELEGHADNVAASLLGGVVATAGGLAVRVPLAVDPAVVVWVPRTTTSTDESRTRIPSAVSLDAAVFNVGRTALLVAALAGGEVGALRTATADRLHQDARFGAAPASRAALDAVLAAGAWCGWLSGSGPAVAALCDAAGAEALEAALAGLTDDGHTKVLRIDHEGAVVTDT